MAKWEKRINDVLKNEKKKHAAVYDLDKRLNDAIHGLSPIGKSVIESVLKKEIDSTYLVDSEVKSYSIEPRYSKDPDELRLLIKVFIEGDFNGHIEIETSKGYRNTDNGRIDIYYIMMSDRKIVSDKELKVKQMYKAYQKYTIANLVDVALDKDIFLEYDDCYKNYTIWHKKPSEYGDSITGDMRLYDEHIHYKKYKSFHDKLNKINFHESIEEYAEEVLYRSNESTTYEWTEYKL